MTPDRGRAPVAAVLLAVTLTACASDSDDGDACSGASEGEYHVHVSGGMLADDVVAPVESVDLDADPPLLSLRLEGVPATERDGAVDLEVGDTFTAKGSTYSVAGFCRKDAWLNEMKG